jgi:hypothetical protein
VRAVFESETAQPLGAPAEGRNPSQITNQPTSQRDQGRQHKGEWLLIEGAQLLVHSRNFAAVRATIRERQILSPFVYYVPTDDESDSVTI